jgi:S1-C subfamily serine protease
MPLVEEIKAGNGDIDGDSAFLGVSTSDINEQPADVLSRARVTVDSGAFIVGVTPGTAADDAGLAEGDVIIAINGEAVAGKDDVGKVIRALEPGDTIQLTILRAGDQRTIAATLGRRGG